MKWIIYIIILTAALYAADQTGVITWFRTHTLKISIEKHQAPTSVSGIRGTIMDEEE